MHLVLVDQIVPTAHTRHRTKQRCASEAMATSCASFWRLTLFYSCKKEKREKKWGVWLKYHFRVFSVRCAGKEKIRQHMFQRRFVPVFAHQALTRRGRAGRTRSCPPPPPNVHSLLVSIYVAVSADLHKTSG